jgi:hypothetical protein
MTELENFNKILSRSNKKIEPVSDETRKVEKTLKSRVSQYILEQKNFSNPLNLQCKDSRLQYKTAIEGFFFKNQFREKFLFVNELKMKKCLDVLILDVFSIDNSVSEDDFKVSKFIVEISSFDSESLVSQEDKEMFLFHFANICDSIRKIDKEIDLQSPSSHFHDIYDFYHYGSSGVYDDRPV